VLACQEGIGGTVNPSHHFHGKEATEMRQTQLRGAQLASGPVSLRDVLPKARFLSGDDIQALSCSADWRACRDGDLFVAVTTADDDGHEHVREAIERGARAVVAERLLPVDVPQVLVKDSRVALGRVCQALAGNPSRELRTIGITGSAGKTVTAMLVASIFEAAGEAAGVMSSIGHSDSLAQQAASDNTPTTAEFASWLARMQSAGCASAVLELSSTALAERRSSGIELDAAILTNIQNVSLREHNRAAAYQQIKRRIFRMLKAGGTAIVNVDDHRCRALLASIDGPCLTFGLHAEADISANVIERHISEQTFLLSAGDDCAPVRTRIIGDQHVSNCLAAAAVGLVSGFDLATVVRGIEAVGRVPGRMERLECGQPFGVFVDAADSPQRLTLAIKTVQQVTRGHVYVVCGASPETDAAHRALLGRVLERGAHVPVITSDEPGKSRLDALAHDVLDGFERPGKAQVIPNREKAIQFALSQAGEGDCVLVAGRGDRVTQLRGSNRGEYDDCETACQWLYQREQQPRCTPRFRVIG
jgi:UDP-N-acetylmuramoyl-L-alanyl-D-glutamate--2,6-diaminopimelate ligase